MRSILSFIACSCLAIGGITLVGCEQQQQPPQSHSDLYGGGNGEFGEDPGTAGVYHHDTQSSPATQPAQSH